VTVSPSRWRVVALAATRWWRHNTKRWWVTVYLTIAVLNLLAFFGWLPFAQAQPGDPFSVVVIVVMFLFAAANQRIGRREWEQRAAFRRWQEDSKALREWFNQP
jgi:hypothetical protein